MWGGAYDEGGGALVAVLEEGGLHAGLLVLEGLGRAAPVPTLRLVALGHLQENQRKTRPHTHTPHTTRVERRASETKVRAAGEGALTGSRAPRS